jgi:hypothetical protein
VWHQVLFCSRGRSPGRAGEPYFHWTVLEFGNGKSWVKLNLKSPPIRCKVIAERNEKERLSNRLGQRSQSMQSAKLIAKKQALPSSRVYEIGSLNCSRESNRNQSDSSLNSKYFLLIQIESCPIRCTYNIF